MRDKTAKHDSLLACEYKHGYASYTIAEEVAKKMNARKKAGRCREKGHAVARIYKCEHCGQYHITGTKDKMKKIKVKHIPTEETIEVRRVGN